MTDPSAEKLKLMVVDDEIDNLDLLYRSFHREFKVFKADSALKALQLLEQVGEMAIIISDQRMPRMNGTEFLSRTVETFPDTIRILLTGYTDVEDLVGAINSGKVFKYITKPWKPEQLQSVVQQAAETYQVVKQRTNALHRALRRESIFNGVTTAIRESLDYRSMLQTVVETIGRTFSGDRAILLTVEPSRTSGSISQFASETFSYPAIEPSEASSAEQNGKANGLSDLDLKTIHTSLEQRQSQLIQTEKFTQLVVPLVYQQEALAVLILYKRGIIHPWSTEEIPLIEGVAEQAALAISQAKLYQRTQAQTEQMRSELAVARQIQSNLLRQSLPQLEYARIQAHCYPAREVGGDFFEVYVHPQGDIWLAVGDVSGKGVPAALFMASAISLLRRELAQETSPEPDGVMRNLNSSLSEDLVGSNCFITMVLARYSPAIDKLVYANAGHIYPLVWSKQRVVQSTQTEPPISVEPNYLKVRGVPLGILPVWKAPAGSLALKSGEVLLLTSDGITEASIITPATPLSSNGAMLQQTGLWQLLSQQQGELNLHRLLAEIQAHNQVQEDDQTILSLEVL